MGEHGEAHTSRAHSINGGGGGGRGGI